MLKRVFWVSLTEKNHLRVLGFCSLFADGGAITGKYQKFLDFLSSFKMVLDQAILTVVVIKVSPLYFIFSNSEPMCKILLHRGKTL